ncbi:MAG: glutamine-synthetase adenylyltransferase, partial [Roseateles sp.]
CELLDRLGEMREFVALEFDALLHDGREGDTNRGNGGCRSCGGRPATLDSEAFADKLPPELAERVRHLCALPKVQALREESKVRLARLIARAAQAAQRGECTMEAATRFVDWVEPLLRRESYLALLVERNEVQQRLLRLLGLARWPMRYLMRHPGVIDELADERLLHSRFDPAEFAAELEARHEAWERSGQADPEALLDTLRRAHHAEVFRTLVRDVESHISVEAVADELSALADATLARTLAWAWKHLKQAHRPEPRFAVIAYGKLGGKELGYGSDLDVVFLYDDADEADRDRAQEIYAGFVRKLITWLTLRTAAGELFDIDTALRPNGNSGLLVTSLAHFEAYQTGRGSNTAWTWEHQAITRARFCAGDVELAERFEAVRRQVLTAPRDVEALRREVQAMREKVRAARPVKRSPQATQASPPPEGVESARGGPSLPQTELFDVKHSEGGMMDAEFALQVLVLAHASAHAELLDNAGNIALLQRAEVAGLLPAGVGVAAANAYRELRRVQHRARLNEQSTALDAEAAAPLAPHRDAVRALWSAVFG